MSVSNSQGGKMHVGMLAYTFYESDYRVRRYAEALAKQGHSVDVICLRRPKQSICDADNGVRVIRIQRRSISERSRLSYLFKLLLFFVKSFVFFSLIHVWRRFHLIHVHNVPDCLVFSTLIPKLTGAKIILDIHDILPELYANKFRDGKNSLGFRSLLLIERISAKWADRVILANHIWYSRYISRSAESSKCSVIMNYPNIKLFSQRLHLPKSEAFTFIYPGSLSWHQGLDIAIRAFAIVCKRRESCRLQIFGDGETRNDLISLIGTLGLKNKIDLCDTLPLEEIPRVIAGADCGIVPKRAHGFGGEAFSTKIWEFMAMGVPVIVSETPIDRYYFDDSQVLFFKPEDPEDLAAKMERIMMDSALRESLANCGTTFARSNSWYEKEVLYHSLIDSLFCPEQKTTGEYL